MKNHIEKSKNNNEASGKGGLGDLFSLEKIKFKVGDIIVNNWLKDKYKVLKTFPNKKHNLICIEQLESGFLYTVDGDSSLYTLCIESEEEKFSRLGKEYSKLSQSAELENYLGSNHPVFDKSTHDMEEEHLNECLESEGLDSENREDCDLEWLYTKSNNKTIDKLLEK